MTKGKIFFLLFLILIPFSCFADEGNFLLDDLIKLAMERNPRIKAAENEVEAYSYKISQERSLPDPMIGFSFKNMGLERITIGEDIMSGFGISFSQTIPFPGKLSLKGEIAGNAFERKREALNGVRLKVIKELKVSYFELFYIHKAIDILNRQKRLLENALSLTEAKYAVGKGVQSDIFKAQVEISKIDEMIIPMKEMIKSLNTRINLLIDLPPDHELGIPEEQKVYGLDISLKDIQRWAGENSPMLKEADIMIHEGSNMVEMSKREFYPNFTVEGGYDYKGSLTPIYEVMVGVEIPLYFKTKQAQRVKESMAQIEGMRNNLASTRNDISFMITENYIKAKASESLVRLYKEKIIPQASLAVESSLANYQVDKIDFIALLSDINTLFSYQMNYNKELSQLWGSVAQLEELSATKIM